MSIDTHSSIRVDARSDCTGHFGSGFIGGLGVLRSSNMALALVTGSSGGIGLAIAEELARKRTDLVLTARSGQKLANICAGFASEHAIRAVPLALDLTQPGSAAALVEQMEVRGLAPDILVNNAGFGTYGEFVKQSVESQVEMIQLNITAVVELTHRLLPGMIARRSGRILNVASTAAFQPGPLMSVYYASKAFVLHFSEAIANELEGTGVTVTALCPGPTTTGFQERAAMTESRLLKAPMMDAESVARAGLDAMFAGRSLVIPGVLNCLVAFSTRFAPRELATRIARQVQERN